MVLEYADARQTTIAKRNRHTFVLKSRALVAYAYPLLLDLANRAVVIVGGGAVAARKAFGVLQADATHVTIIAPELKADFPSDVTHIKKTYDKGDLTAADLVFAATDSPDVNAQVVRDARAVGILVNRTDVDEADPGDFTVPATLRMGDLTISVSAGGSPAVAARVREVIKESLPQKWVALSKTAKEIRRGVIGRMNDDSDRRKILIDLASDQAADKLADGGKEALVNWLRARHPQLELF